MSVYLSDGLVLLHSSLVAVDSACCCTNTGACCLPDGVTCHVETESQCAIDGGTYQGNGTPCTPNPCPGGHCHGCSCGFSGFITAQRYSTKTIHIVRFDHTRPNPGGCVHGCDSSWDYTETIVHGVHADCSCSTVSDTCTGTEVVTDCGGITTHCDPSPSCVIHGGCLCDTSCTSPTSTTIIDDTHETQHCRHDDAFGGYSQLDITTTLSNPIC